MMTFKSILTVLLTAAVSSSALSQPKPRVEYDQAPLESETGRKTSVQGTAVCDGLLFSLRDKGWCVVTSLKDKSLVSEFPLSVRHKSNHANDAFFGPEKFNPSDRFPLLYVSQCKSDPAPVDGVAALDTLSRLCYVERILTDADGKPIGTSLVQVVSFAPSEWSSRLWAFDRSDPQNVWVYGNTKGNEAPGNRIVFVRLSFPKFDPDNFVVSLSDSDIKEKFYADETLPSGERGPQNNILQGACIDGGVLFLPVGNGNKKHPSELFIVNIKDRKGVRIDYTPEIPAEMEDMDIWGKRIVCTTNSHKYGRKVYSFPVRKLKKLVK